MQTARDDVIPMMSTGRNDAGRAILSELVSAILQIRRSLEAIEAEIVRATEPEDETADDIVVLDDVTPGYARSCALLRECDAGLSTAVHLLLETMAPGNRTGGLVPPGVAPPAHAF